jgi:hypothetical protein
MSLVTRRIDVALYAVVMEAYVHGLSTRKVDDLVAALGVDAGISKPLGAVSTQHLPSQPNTAWGFACFPCVSVMHRCPGPRTADWSTAGLSLLDSLWAQLLKSRRVSWEADPGLVE